MADHEIALVVNKSDETIQETPAADRRSDQIVPGSPDTSHSKISMETFSKRRERRFSRKWLTMEKSQDRRAPFLRKWNKIFLASCLVAVLLDPLFLYIPIINQDFKCVKLDQNLKIAALILRLTTDLFYIMEIFVQIYISESSPPLMDQYRYRNCSKLEFLWRYLLPAIAWRIWRSYIFIDILAIIPFPQVLILICFSKIRGMRSLNTKKLFMNFFVVMQYVPRVLRIYLICKEFHRTPNGKTAIWIKGVLNFFMYILASHVLGAMWYFFAVQRMTDCWIDACRNENGCDTATTLGCHKHSFRNVTFLNDCSTNTTLFDFGMFTSVLQTDITRSTNFLNKLSNCFCWGLRNLSSLGSNLQPSTSTWENLFVASISIIGLLLFLYLIGNLQTYMQFDISRIETNRHKMKVEEQMEEKGREVEWWLAKNGVPERANKDIKRQIMKMVQQELEEERHADLDYIFLLLPWDIQNYIESCMPLTRLKQVPILKNVDAEVLKEISEHLHPIKYTNNVIIQDDGPLYEMFFIVDGFVIVEKRNHPGQLRRCEREYYGEKLICWPSWLSSFPEKLPTALEYVEAIGDVEALVLTASDMQSVGSRFKEKFMRYDKLKDQQLLDHMESVVTTIKVFTTEELKKSGLLCEGRSSRIYKGRLVPDKTVVAIKSIKERLLIPYPFDKDNFINEVIVFSQINHGNVVKLLGYCIETELPLLVYEFVNNGSLFDHIHKQREGPTLTLELRMKIAAEIAGALSYLQSASFMPFNIQPNITSRKILLDDNYMAKLSGFVSTQNPEKSNVYGFGIVLAELLSSKRLFPEDGEQIDLPTLFISTMQEGRLDQILDHDIVNEQNFEIAGKVADLANRCLKETGAERPSMEEVTMEMEGIMKAYYGREG